ncbi:MULTISPECIES: 16S rRNA (cytidine(1402)-2'-O)-methyltransferase [Tabrizicola]|uniref:16S rRNA (cytidine(1402)-2'-O)-methyltransferase n=1 Tax=Tabrizicola TaxID=1443919 RepID=UPI00352E537B
MSQPSDPHQNTPKPDLRAIPPGLHFVSTPIGAARDITLRALDVLAGADVLVAEDTRTLRHLMEIHGVPLRGRPLIAYHDHSGEGALSRILALIGEGRSVAYASEAGTPLISDPGFELARAVAAAGLPMTAAPGPCAAICALTLSALPSDRFLFAGFAPTAQGARRDFLAGLAAVQATLILYESPKRLAALLADLAGTLGAARRAAVCRELTKRFEEVVRGTLAELADDFSRREVRGEVVVLVDRAAPEAATEADIRRALETALQTMRVKDAATFVSQTLGVSRKLAYQIAVDLRQE